MLIFCGTVQSQVSVSINFGAPPSWGPAESSGVRFYYLPDIQVYYDVSSGNYIYFSDGRWIQSSYLPASYGSYDLYGGYKVMLRDYHGERPYEHFEENRRSYPHGYNRGQPQKTYGERPGRGNSGDKKDKHEDKGHENRGNGKGHDNGGNGKHGHGKK